MSDLFDDDVSGIWEPPLELGREPTPDDKSQVIAGRYAIVERIGEGGMGQVVKVKHLRLNKHFALKLMHADLSLDPAVREVFHREARLASALSHPNIVSIVDFGEDPDWGVFIVMELVPGDTLTERIAAHGALSVKITCDVTMQILDALRVSHAQDVVHGDIKADNVKCIISEPDERRSWAIMLLDFGMAQLATGSAQKQERIAGTPEYLAPERITGMPPSPAADVYAVGILMYEMLTGNVPFAADDPTAVLQMQLRQPARPIAEARGAPVPDPLATIIAKAMAKDPGQRYASVEELRAELQVFMRQVGLRQRAGRRRTATEFGETRTDAAAAAFDAVGIAAAGIRADGTFVVANPPMRQLFKQDDLEGTSVFSSFLGEVHPELAEDLRTVAMDGKLVRRRLKLTTKSGKVVTMRVLLTPATGSGGDCVLALYPIKS